MKSSNTKQDMLPGNGLFQRSFHQWVVDGWRDTQNETTYQSYWGCYGAACYDWGLGDSHGSSTYTSTQITRSLIHSNWGGGRPLILRMNHGLLSVFSEKREEIIMKELNILFHF